MEQQSGSSGRHPSSTNHTPAPDRDDAFHQHGPFFPAETSPATSAAGPSSAAPASLGRPPPEDEFNVKFLGTHQMLFNKTAHQNTPYSVDEPERYAEVSGLAFPQVLPEGTIISGSATTSPSVMGTSAVVASTAVPSLAPSSRKGTVDPYAEYWSANGEYDPHNSAKAPFLPQYSSPATYHSSTHNEPVTHLPEPDEYYGPPPGEYSKSCYQAQYNAPSSSRFGSQLSREGNPYPGGSAQFVKPWWKRETICGLPSKLFWIIIGCVVMAIIVIAAVVGGVLSSDAKRRASQQRPVSEQGAINPGLTLRSDSEISAVNWTQPTGEVRHGVFTQDTNQGIQLSVQEDEQSWRTYNISKLLEDAGNPINVKRGSPLAAVASGPPWYNFEVRVYYVDGDSFQIQEIKTTDVGYQKWDRGDLPNKPNDPSREAGKTTQIGAVWHRCDQLPSCTDYIYVTYQNAERTIKMLNSSDWTKLATFGSDTLSRSAVAMSEFAESRVEPSEMRLYYDNQGTLSEYKFNRFKQWEPGQRVVENSVDISAPKLASAPYKQSKRTLLLQNDPDGTLYCHVWDQTTWTRNRRARFLGGPSQLRFSSLALDRDQRLYGVELASDGGAPAIHVLKWTEADPFSFEYIGQIGGRR
ncbi:hypothetical protein MGG_00718 [Pyricularia oryzae 70-15]|uniref:Fucose-specific lectin n=3 Tax=Pyricularia oryzae TaxID=318829 RepID=G4NEX7_PYRO7|nr:uncharacterized protein MGG_00718 [Pyricularia oryzae 70-15]EHA48703.1 hypothetical protein MGG_00718 [Pyricularia oryzae 70-15]ELQ36061.1 hypothetical protein OOU_Y34scaffold00669g46 [Pyricularia oryzae Y34]KAI7928945.1 hypothetical protein M9X92_001524 [Pyricularia oryzae]KAI7929602.1 hypothetical protein M0657_002079 [Pyricularia oryzae]